MGILIDPKKCQWLDSQHSVFVCLVKDPIKGWVNITCHQHSDGIAKTLWDFRKSIDIMPYAIKLSEEPKKG